MILLLVAACLRTHSGTAVGNPGDLDAKASRLDPTLTLDAVTVPVALLEIEPCAGPGIGLPATITLDGLAPSVEPVHVPGGTWCGLALRLSGPIVVEGTTEAGTAFTVALAPELAVEGEVEVDGQTLLLEVALALEAPELDALGPVVDLAEDDPLAVDWASVAEPVVWEDVDRDGLLSAADEPVARAVPFDTGVLPFAAAKGEAGCSCGSSATPFEGLALVVAISAARRRSRTPRRT